MISEARRLHPPIVVVGTVFVALFLVILGGTVVSVVSREDPQPATMLEVPLPAGSEIVDTHALCSPDACDGEGAVLAMGDMSDEAAFAIVQGRLRNQWNEFVCDDDRACFASGDLQASVRLWRDVDDAAAAPMRAHLDAIGAEQHNLLYLRVRRCGILVPCS
jgi:hypothetical protein